MRRATLFRWASTSRAHGMPHPAALERRGYRRVRRHPRWPDSWLMVQHPMSPRDAEARGWPDPTPADAEATVTGAARWSCLPTARRS
jgi:hypothetical protein